MKQDIYYKHKIYFQTNINSLFQIQHKVFVMKGEGKRPLRNECIRASCELGSLTLSIVTQTD